MSCTSHKPVRGGRNLEAFPDPEPYEDGVDCGLQGNGKTLDNTAANSLLYPKCKLSCAGKAELPKRKRKAVVSADLTKKKKK